MKRKMKRTVFSLFLTLCLLINVAPITFAEEIHTEEANAATGLEDLLAGVVSVEEFYGSLDSQTVPEIIGYDYAVSKAHVQRLYEKEGNHLDTVIFRNADGTETAYIFDYPVKYVDESGKTKDITLDIADSAVSGEFKTADGSAVTTFSRNLSDGIGLRGNNTSLSLIPHLPTAKAGATLSSTATLTANSTAERIDRKTVSYDYDSKTTIEYSLTYTGFKEDIVVSEYTGQTEYDFTLYTNGLTLTEVDGSFYLVDGNNTVKAALGDIIIFTADEKNNTMGEMTAQTVIENQEYLLTISVDAEYLAAEETVYPIRIDPSVEICYDNDGAGAIQDVTLNSLQGSSGTSGSLMVGLRETYGKSRILMKFPGLDVNALGSNVSITEATVELRDLMCETAGLEVSCYVFTGNVWSESTANWSNVNPDSYSTFLSSQTISYANGTQQSTAHRYAFDITKAVEGWRAGNYNPNKGILFKASSSVEGGATYKSKTMASYNRSSNKPSLSVTYLTGTHLAADDTYYLNNQNCGDYLHYTSSGVAAISGLISSLGDSIRWEIRAVSGGYIIRSKSDTTKYLGVPTSTGSSTVSLVTVSETAIPDRCLWKIQISAVGGCLVKSAYNSRYLYSAGNAVSTISGTGTAGTEAYDKRVWRIASTTYYGNTSSYDMRELSSDYYADDLTLDVCDIKSLTINGGYSDVLWMSVDDFVITVSDTIIANVTEDNEIEGYSRGICAVFLEHKVTGMISKHITAVTVSSSYTATMCKFEELYDAALAYDSTPRDAALLTLQFIRRGKYDSANWSTVAGSIDNQFVEYITDNHPGLARYFTIEIIEATGTFDQDYVEEYYYQDPSGEGYVDFVHLCATLNGLIYDSTGFKAAVAGEANINNLCGWAGDLQTLCIEVLDCTNNSNDYNTVYNATYELIGDPLHTLSMMDLLADTDAYNIYTLLNSSVSNMTSVFSGYYSNYSDERYTRFTNGWTKQRIYNCVRNYTTNIFFLWQDWPLLEGYEITNNQANAIAWAFTDFIWEKIQNE